jgi:hypothetical protein
MGAYLFRTSWQIAAPQSSVFTALADLVQYPTWWPQVVSARQLDDSSGELRWRAMLPIEVRFVAHRELEDPAAGVLRVRVDGDFIGTGEWTLSGEDGTTTAVFHEEFDVHNRLVRAGGRLVRPALRLNHDRTMRAGEKGLRRLLES